MSITKDKIINSYIERAKAKCCECGWEGTQGDCGSGRNGFVCPKCGKASVEIAEPKVIGSKGELS